ncbi:winged helix-turn-helix domain-containing protein [Streptomyces adustus]|uniref:Winged helix-turn-helix domain-containing protein n=2 Tax=Streptomyces adustus TaxID=1609272 RepID=A0A5N8VRD9_9ACTN|nr:winged helix-turn-helix domain-containing protein [Streptomyces adustus]
MSMAWEVHGYSTIRPQLFVICATRFVSVAPAPTTRRRSSPSGVSRPPAQTWRILRQTDWSVRVPRRRAAERDEDAVPRGSKRRAGGGTRPCRSRTLRRRPPARCN